jgi:NADH-quinone oxidoreductase subunit N
MPLEQFIPFVPEIALAVAAFVLLLAGVTTGRRGTGPITVAALVGLGITAVLVWVLGRPDGAPETILGGMLVLDGFAVFFKLLLLVATALSLVMATGYLKRFNYGGGEFAALYLTALLGMFIMVSAASLASMYVGLELMALSVYVLVGYCKHESSPTKVRSSTSCSAPCRRASCCTASR